MFKILDLIPVIHTDSIESAIEDRRRYAKHLHELSNGSVELEIWHLEKGTASIEGMYDEALNAPYILEKVAEAERVGYDAVVIDCFGDPALDAARELVKIPVIGANHSASFLAVQLAGRYSVISILPETIPQIYLLARKYGVLGQLASVRTISVPVLDLEKRAEEVLERSFKEANRAILEDHAGAIVLGCTGMSFLADGLAEKLKERGVPIVEPFRAAVHTAISWVMLGLSHSKASHPFPRRKLRNVDSGLPS